MIHLRRPLAALLILLTSLQAPAQKTDPAEPAHADDLVIGPRGMTIFLRPEFGAQPKAKEVSVAILTKTKLVFKDKDGRATVKDGVYVPRVTGAKENEVWVWNEKAKQYEGPAVPPAPIRIYPEKLKEQQVAAYLTIRAEFLYLELANAVARKDAAGVQRLLRFARAVTEFAKRESLGTEVIALYDLDGHVEAQNKLLKELGTGFQELQKKKVNEEKNGTVVRRSFEERAALGLLQTLAVGNVDTVAGRESESLSYAVALGRLGDLSQSAARRSLDERLIKEATALYQEADLAPITKLRHEFVANQTKLSDRAKEVWKSLGVDTAMVQGLDTFADSLLDKKDLTAAIADFSARSRHLEEKGFASPQLLVMLNTLKASDERRTPKDATDRAERSERIFKLAQETIAAAQLIPDDPIFLPDRISVLIAGAKLVQMATCYSHDPRANDPWSAYWDWRADYGARALNLAGTAGGTLADPDGSARALRAALLFQRGLHSEALEAARKLEELASLDPAHLINLARFYSTGNKPKEAAGAVVKAFKLGYRDARTVETDPDMKSMWDHQRTTKGDLWKYRDNPELTVFLDPNPLSIGDAFPSYTLEVKNNTLYPVVNIKVKYVGTFTQNGKDIPVSSQELVIDYLAPAGARGDTFVWPDAFKSPGRHDKSNLQAAIDRRPQGGRLIQGLIPVKVSDRSLSLYWSRYRPHWYYDPYW